MEYFRPQDPIKYDSKACVSEARELAITGSSVGTDFLIDFISPASFVMCPGQPLLASVHVPSAHLPRRGLPGSQVKEQELSRQHNLWSDQFQ